jgi:transcriptional regulator with XRE-family HTH domain
MIKNSVTNRFVELYQSLVGKGIVENNASQFAREIGCTPSMMNEILKGRSNVGMEILQNTVKKYREHGLNPAWLFLGEGNMLENPEEGKTKSYKNVANITEVVDKMPGSSFEMPEISAAPLTGPAIPEKGRRLGLEKINTRVTKRKTIEENLQKPVALPKIVPPGDDDHKVQSQIEENTGEENTIYIPVKLDAAVYNMIEQLQNRIDELENRLKEAGL